jgi:hypothetical protein
MKTILAWLGAIWLAVAGVALVAALFENGYGWAAWALILGLAGTAAFIMLGRAALTPHAK